MEEMNSDVVIPSFGESIRDVKIGMIHVQSGDYVTQDQDIAELETDKLTQTMYAPCSGVLTWKVSPGDVVPIGGVIATIRNEEALEDRQEKEEGNASDSVESQSVFSFSTEPEGDSNIPPSYPSIEENHPAPVSANKEAKDSASVIRRPMSSLRKVIAQRLMHAKQTTAMLTTFNEVDLHRIVAIREQHKEQFMERFQVKLGYMSFFVRAAALALQQFPIVNSYIDGDDIVTHPSIDIGVAVATEKGVVVPIVRNAHLLSYAEIEKTIDDMAQRARKGKLQLDELQGGSFTITNGGVFGSLLSTPILNPPQCAILGMHKIQKRAVVVDDQIVIRPMMYLALSYDHRLIDGQEAVSFLVAIKEELEDPDRQLLGL